MYNDKKKYLDGESASTHILEQLEKAHIPSTTRADNILITCPYHSPIYPHFSYHRLSINLVPKYRSDGTYIPVGLFHCWSCGKSGFFNQLITDKELPEERRLKVEPLPVAGSHKDKQLFSFKIKEVKPCKFQEINPFLISRWEEDWRGIPAKLIRKMGGKCYFDYNPNARTREGVKLDIGGTNRLLFYAYDEDGNKVGWIALANEKDRKKNKNNKKFLKQKNMEGEWASKTILFHEKYKDNTPIVLTEGPFDALRLIRDGFQACCVLGAGNWSKEKRDLIASKASHLIILFDGDETGYKDGKMIEDDIKKYLPTLRLRLPIYENKEDQIDPGNMPEKFVKILRNKMKKFIEGE
jgi:5S rRNA maturation endonuclease (ribonuclease M5)